MSYHVEVVFVAITSTKLCELQTLVNKESCQILVIGMQWLFWKMMLLSAIYQDSCHWFCHCFYCETVQMIASWLVEEDVLQICHREHSKFLTNYFVVASVKNSTNSKISSLLQFKRKGKILKEIISWYKKFMCLNFIATKVLQFLVSKFCQSIITILYVSMYCMVSYTASHVYFIGIFKPQIVCHTSRLLCCLDPDNWVYNSLATAVLYSFESWAVFNCLFISIALQ